MQAVSNYLFGNHPAPALPAGGPANNGNVPLPNPNLSPAGALPPLGQNHVVTWLKGIAEMALSCLKAPVTNPLLRIPICLVIVVVAAVIFVGLGTSALTPINIGYAAFGLTFTMLIAFGIAVKSTFDLMSGKDDDDDNDTDTLPEPPPPTFRSALGDLVDMQPF